MRVHTQWHDDKAEGKVARSTSPELWTREAAARWVADVMESLGGDLISVTVEAR